MEKIKIGDKLKCIFDAFLPDCEYKPPIEAGKEYECKAIITDSKGNDHIDIGLPLSKNINFISSYATKEVISKTAHLCHPNRFIIIP